ncbi:ATP-dependent RNA helicase DDX18 [Nosema granulosis]|uniref:ATP-dependent RNA helicase DDX18 n=1 Tax=Nosema granulosis TaxID=83296 RepID=A0A9P6KY48_9MICR|nr:ATP-dependent RNA helicase DDX18 [Nosema granulosis]
MPNLNSPKLAPNAPKKYPYSKPHSSPFPVAQAISNPVSASSTAITDSVKKNISGDDYLFESLASLVTLKTMQAIRMLGFPSMREIQARTIPALLQGKNLRYEWKSYPPYHANIFVHGTCLCSFGC